MSRDVLVLCYHAVSPRWPADLSVTPERLEQQVSFLVEHGYRGATFLEAATGPPAEKTVAVTFDDAYRSVMELAFPILSRWDLPGTVFVPTNFAGTQIPMAWAGNDRWLNGPYESEMICMSWEELGRLADAGWEVGSHTQSHPRLSTLDDATLAAELGGSREECERRLGQPCRTMAHPYGHPDGRVLEATRKAGYVVAADLPDRFNMATPFMYPRVGIYHRDTDRRFRLKVSRTTRRLRASPAWSALLRVRRALGLARND